MTYSLKTYKEAGLTTLKDAFNYLDNVYVNGSITATLDTVDTSVKLDVYTIAGVLIENILTATYSLTANTPVTLKAINSNANITFDLDATNYPGARYKIILTIDGTDIDSVYRDEVEFSVVDAPKITSPTISEASIYQDQSVTFTASVTSETNNAWVAILDGNGKEVYNKEMTITGTAATCRTDPLKIPVGVYSAGQVRIYARNDEDAVIDITSAVYDATLALTVLASPAMPAGLLTWLNQEATLEAALTKDNYGQYSYDTAVTVACRIAQKVQKIINSQGKEVISHSMVYLNGSQTVTVNDRITLPDGTTPEILQIGSTAKANGVLIMKVIYT